MTYYNYGSYSWGSYGYSHGSKSYGSYSKTTYYDSKCHDKNEDKGSIGGRLTLDVDCDNTENAAGGGYDEGLAGQIVTLTDKYGNVVATTTTDESGTYKFDELREGSYKVVFPEVAGYTYAEKDVGSYGEDSDANADGATDTITISKGQDLWNVDASLQECEIEGDCITIEAEDMYLCGFKSNCFDGASGGQVIKGSTCYWSSAKTYFEGSEGTYDLKLTYLDEDDGQGKIKIFVNGEKVADFVLDADNGGDGSEPGVFSEYVVENVELSKGDKIEIWGLGDGGEYVRIDKLEICKDDEPLLGALGDLVWFDVDKDGVQDDDEDGVEGVTVNLLQAGAVIATATTDINGNYLFDELPAGDYQVQFVLPAGRFAFTEQDAGSDDAADSDADVTTGLTGIITLAEGETNLTVDSGIIIPNEDPDATADSGMGCADKEIIVDLSDNISDADGDTVTITAINGQAIADGETILIGGTGEGAVSVTLDGDQFIFDGETAYSALDIGEQASEQFTYTVDDGMGGTATSTIDITFCGDANTLMSLCETLPDTASIQVINENVPLGSSDEAYTLQISGTGGRVDGIYTEAYCLSAFESTDLGAAGSDINLAPVYDGDLFCSLESDIPAGALQTVGINGATAAENLDLINWILNQDFGGQGYSDGEIQSAIWALTDGEALEDLGLADGIFIQNGAGEAEDAKEILDEALAFDALGAEFMPGKNDIVALVVDPDDSGFEQPFVFGVLYNDIDCLC
ncbi:SdrD B-like domain-containing protein [Poseidonocella sedimentorum]|uniref:Cna protein B-type domain-containing protein n=1 Tax=Poseidonocella sedimentorum TaxID=871652 RepID=A0A1I6E509_9RHOB|nr:SdrD B-like domain-containing protein [Poseidonocella sedimentorum]SFR12830.1 Cna protein B-type domain-containing protein [Poseidonocella sedimentorum]